MLNFLTENWGSRAMQENSVGDFKLSIVFQNLTTTKQQFQWKSPKMIQPFSNHIIKIHIASIVFNS